MDGPSHATDANAGQDKHAGAGSASRHGQGCSGEEPCCCVILRMNDVSSDAPAVGYIVKMFPRLSETFILNELLELEQQGLPLHIFSLKRPSEQVSHAQALEVRSPVT